MVSRARPTAPPLDDASLGQLALSYVGRFQTSSGRLARYLHEKLRQRGWAGDRPPEVDAVIVALAERGYLDDAAFAQARARVCARRGLGRARLAARLSADGIDRETIAQAGESLDGPALAVRFAQSRRIGPFGPPADPAARRRQLAAMVRAGHSPALARAVLDAPDEAAALALVGDDDGAG